MMDLFKTDGLRAPAGVHPITPDFIVHFGWALGRVLSKHAKGNAMVLIGKDTRISGYIFESALEAGLLSAGINVRLLGPLPSPAIAYLTRTFNADAGIVISASHNAYTDNGIKIFSSNGTKLSEEMEEEINLQITHKFSMSDSRSLGKVLRIDDAVGRYIEFCKSTFSLEYNLSGITIVLDCANGAAYKVAPAVFAELGANIIAINCNPNGYNINDNCGSVHPESLVLKVKETAADIGIAFDGDGDRVILVDHSGTVIDGDQIVYILAKYMSAVSRLKGGVVGTIMSNSGLELSLSQLGIPFVRTSVGDKHISRVLQDKGWNLGGEQSGHIIYSNATTTGDGIIAALQVLEAMLYFNKTLADIASEMDKIPQHLLNVSCTRKVKADSLSSIANKYNTLLSGRGRVLIRESGTEPVIRLLIELKHIENDSNLVDSITKDVQSVIDIAV